jgi:short-chain fatty acids transporter
MSALEAFRRFGARLSDFTERWVPDAWVICLMLTAVAIVLCILGAGATPEQTVLAWGQGVWKLLALAMQFTIAMVAAYACVISRPIYRLIDRLARVPNPERPVQAVAMAAIFSMVTGYLNWALCLVACALFMPFLLKHNPRADIRVVIASAYLGLGTVWHGGLSGSAPLILATPDNPLIKPVGGTAPVVHKLYPITDTLFSTFNLVYITVIAIVALATVCLLHPKENVRTLTPEQLDAILPSPPPPDPLPSSPAEHIEQFKGWTWLAALLLAYPLVHAIVTKGFGTNWTIDSYNVTFLVLALLLHGKPTSFLRACRKGADSAIAIVVQFPFYAGIFGLLQFTGLSHWLGELFASIATTKTFPFVVYAYSALMTMFIPSAGAKWMIEAPFLVPAGDTLNVSVVSIVLSYAYGDTTTHLIQPFFAIPLLAVTRLRFGDIVGYTFIVSAVLFAVSSVAMFLIPPNL